MLVVKVARKVNFTVIRYSIINETDTVVGGNWSVKQETDSKRREGAEIRGGIRFSINAVARSSLGFYVRAVQNEIIVTPVERMSAGLDNTGRYSVALEIKFYRSI